MATLHLSEWNDGFGNWHCADVNAIGKGSAIWWRVARAIKMPLQDYVNLVIAKYKPDRIAFCEEKFVLVFSWKSQVAMRKYKNELNALIRKYNIEVY